MNEVCSNHAAAVGFFVCQSCETKLCEECFSAHKCVLNPEFTWPKIDWDLDKFVNNAWVHPQVPVLESPWLQSIVVSPIATDGGRDTISTMDIAHAPSLVMFALHRHAATIRAVQLADAVMPMRAFMRVLKTCTALQTIDLTGVQFSEQDTKELAEAIVCWPDLEILSLVNCFADKCVYNLQYVLSNIAGARRGLVSLNLSDNALGDIMPAVFHTFKSARDTIQELVLNNIGLGDRHLAALCAICVKADRLRIVSLVGNKIGVAGVRILARHFYNQDGVDWILADTAISSNTRDSLALLSDRSMLCEQAQSLWSACSTDDDKIDYIVNTEVSQGNAFIKKMFIFMLRDTTKKTVSAACDAVAQSVADRIVADPDCSSQAPDRREIPYFDDDDSDY